MQPFVTQPFPTQTVGGPILTTAGTVLESMRRVNTDVENLDGEIVANLPALQPAVVASWASFRVEWQTFYNENQSEIAMYVKGTGTVMRETQDFSSRLVSWRAAIAAMPGVKLQRPAPTVLVDPSKAPSPSLDWARLVEGISVLGGVLLLGYVAVVYVPRFLPSKGAP